jgi:hypothetical protein
VAEKITFLETLIYHESVVSSFNYTRILNTSWKINIVLVWLAVVKVCKNK